MDLTNNVPSPEEQANTLRNLIKQERIKAGTISYLISCQWLTNWKCYTGFGGKSGGSNPGPISNDSIQLNGNVRKNAQEHKDFEVVTEAVWSKYFEWYGGGPVLSVEVFLDPFKNIPVSGYRTVTLYIYHKDDFVAMDFSKYSQVNKVKQRACEHFGIDSEIFRLRDFSNQKHGQLLRENETVIENVLSDDQKLLLERKTSPTLNLDLPVPSAVASMLPRAVHQKIGIASVMNNYDNELKKSTSHQGQNWQTALAPSAALGLCGFQNIGNSCFMNASLQCIMHTKPLKDFFLQPDYKANGNFVSSFYVLLRDYWSGQFNCLAPRELRSLLGRFAPQFASYSQQDAMEFIVFLLEFLHNDLNIAETKKQKENDEGDGTNDSVIASKSWNNFKQCNDSPIIDIFHGLLKSELKCPNCDSIFTSFEPFDILSLPIPTNDKKKTPTFFFVPYDPLLPKRQMRIRNILKLSNREISQKLGSELRIENLSLAFATINNKGSITWLERPKSPSGNGNALFAFEVPDTTKFYSVVKLDAPKVGTVDGPFLMEISGPDATKEEVQQRCNNFFDYLWDPTGKYDNRSITKEIDQIRQKLKSSIGKSKDLQRFAVTVTNGGMKSSFSKSSLLKCEDSAPFLSKRHVHAKVNAAYMTQQNGFNWPRLKRETTELLLPGGGFGEVELEKCVKEFISKGSLDNSNKWECPKCAKKVCATKQMQFWKLPQVLIVHLKRFQQTEEGGHRKLETNVIFPESLDMKQFVSDSAESIGNSMNYRLYATTEHMGCINSGHFTARAYSETKEAWYSFNDSQSKQCTDQSIHNTNAYILFYQLEDKISE